MIYHYDTIYLRSKNRHVPNIVLMYFIIMSTILDILTNFIISISNRYQHQIFFNYIFDIKYINYQAMIF